MGDLPTAGAILPRPLPLRGSYRLKDGVGIADKGDKNKKTKSKSNEPSTGEPAR
jgi:hypothetical protein